MIILLKSYVHEQDFYMQIEAEDVLLKCVVPVVDRWIHPISKRCCTLIKQMNNVGLFVNVSASHFVCLHSKTVIHKPLWTRLFEFACLAI